jgi:hypothetical protein
MGKEKALYVPEAMEQRIQRAGGLNGLIRCDEHANRLEPREFTAFLAKAIETRKNPWPSQKEVQDGTAPMQIIQEFKAWQRQRGLQSPPPRGSSPLSPRVRREDVPVEGENVDRLYQQGCKVIVVPDPDEPRTKYGFLIFLELDLVVGSELGPLPANAIYGGQLFMPHDFPTAFGPCKTEKGGVEEPQTAPIIEEVVNMALGQGVEDYRHQRNRAKASWGVLTREKDELRTMTWADFGFRFNIEPFRTEAVSTWVTLPGGAADYWVDNRVMDMSNALDSLEVWNTAGTRGGEVLVLPKFIQRRNFKGLDGLRITYGDS